MDSSFSKTYTSTSRAEADKIAISDEAYAVGEAIHELIRELKRGRNFD